MLAPGKSDCAPYFHGNCPDLFGHPLPNRSTLRAMWTHRVICSTTLMTRAAWLLTLAACSPVLSYQRPPTPAKPADITQPAAAQGQTAALRAIVVPWKGAKGAPSGIERTEEQARIRAEMISGMARDGSRSFGVLLRDYHEGASTHAVSRAVSRNSAVMPPDARDAGFSLQPGGVSGPIRTDEGYFVVQRGDIAEPVETGPQQIAAKHILFSYKGARGPGEQSERSKEEALALAERVRAQLIEDPSKWLQMAAEHSDEPGAGDDGGDLGTFGRGMMVPSFERAAFSLDVDEISQVTESPFGFHIILRTK